MHRNPPFIDSILGPHVVGVMMAIFLFGLVTIQAFTYFQNYPEDSRGTKALVGFIWVLLFAHTLISAFSLYRRAVTDFGQMSDLKSYPEALCGAFSLSGVIGATVQSYFAYRLRMLSGRSAISQLCWGLSFLRMASIFAISVTTCRAKTVEQYVTEYAWLVITSLSISAFVDVMIAAALSYCLYRRRKDVFKNAQRVVDKLIAWSIHTGALTSISSILMLALYVAVDGFAWMAVYLVLSGLFANYLLGSLNARQSLRSDMYPKFTFLDMVTMSFQENPSLPSTTSLSLQTVTVELRGHAEQRTAVVRMDKHPDLEHGVSTR
ncbi:hypothetical protein BDZ94DRAFT_1313044 [Collybia nuda]|uniref:DUF6534 domain-containing protein n=1 Tax=Collybia nuda TaxID=64659 RepID=A0A9P5XZV5_9AGAR|nr:hypothetical protein BDZ94DRAFT_1313044 [Collybia nuda]